MSKSLTWKIVDGSERKSARVECALVIVAFCAILLTIVTLARALQHYHLSDNAAPKATRSVVVRGLGVEHLAQGGTVQAPATGAADGASSPQQMTISQ
jgi:hypothetical protein